MSCSALAQALADVFVKDEWSPQIAVQKMEYLLEKHGDIVRSAMQASVDSLVEHWMRDLDELQQVSSSFSPLCSLHLQPTSLICARTLQNENDQLGHLEESLAKERERQAAARKRAEEAERLKAEELSSAAERQLQRQAKLAEAEAERDAREARKALEDAMELEMDMAESAVSCPPCFNAAGTASRPRV